jgi:hypothetical protein
MANKKFSEFTLKTDPANVDFLVGYDGTDNVRIDPSDIGGGATNLNELTDCLVDTASLYVGEVPSGLTGSPQGNTVLGIDAGNALTSGYSNTLVGANAASGTTVTGHNNSSLGKNSLLGLTSGYSNIAIGADAGDNVTTGHNNIIIGYNTEASSATVNDEITLGNTGITSFRIPGLQSGASDGDVLTFNSSAGKLELQAAGGGGASDLNGLSDCEVYTKSGNGSSYFIGTAPATGSTTVGYGFTAVGSEAGAATDMSNSFNYLSSFFGWRAGKSSTTPYQGGITAIGAQAGENNSTGSMWTNIGTGAGQIQNQDGGVAIGYQACWAGTNSKGVAIGRYASIVGSSSSSVSIGENSNRNNTATGTVSLGYQSGYSNTFGGANTNLGYKAGYANTVGGAKVNVGYEAGLNNTGSNNVFLGKGAGKGSGSGSQTIAIGQGVMESGSAASNSVFIGNYMAANTTTGANYTVAIGSNCLSAAGYSGESNTVVGHQAGNNLSSGDDNTCIGHLSGQSISTASSNVALGHDALGYHNGDNNVAIGGNAMKGSSSFTSTTSGNVAIGFNAGGAAASAFTNSILIGQNAETSPQSQSNYIVLGNSSNNILQMPGITSGASNGDVLMFDTANFPFNSLKLYPSGTTPSDERDKKDIEDLPYGLAFINALQPRKYVWDNRVKTIDTESFDEDGNPITITEEFVANEKGKIGFGFIAQELQEVDNEVLQLVNDSNKDSLRINYSKLVPVLVQAIKELKAEIELLKA